MRPAITLDRQSDAQAEESAYFSISGSTADGGGVVVMLKREEWPELEAGGEEDRETALADAERLAPAARWEPDEKTGGSLIFIDRYCA